MKSYTLIILFSYILCAISIGILAYSYPQIPDIVAIHHNLLGEADGWGSKNTLILFPAINIAIVGLISFLITKPEILNYPIEVHDGNRETVYRKMQVFLSILSFYISGIFLYFIIESSPFFDLKSGTWFYLLGGITILPMTPILLIAYLKRTK